MLLDSFLDTLSEAMLFRLFSEVLVCVAGAFERMATFLAHLAPQDPEFLALDPAEWKQRCVVNRGESKSSQPHTIDSYFSQSNDPNNTERAVEETGIILSIYGSEEKGDVSGMAENDPLRSFTKTTITTIQNDPVGYKMAMSDFFAGIIKNVATKYPKQILDCLNSRPFLYFLKYGRYYISTILNCPLPSSYYHSYSKEALLTLFAQIITIPELSLEIVPALQYASFVLDMSQSAYRELIRGEQTIPAVVQSFYYYCLHICSVIDPSHDNHTLLIIGRLLGQLGAIAPNRFEAKKDKTAIRPILSEFDLSCHMIRQFFVKDLMGLPKRDIQNRIALTVQRLLRFLENKLSGGLTEGLTADRELLARVAKAREQANKNKNDSGSGDTPVLKEQHLPVELQSLFSEEEVSVISQYWRTEYAVRNESSVAYKGFEGISVKSYGKWVSRFASRLLILCPREESSLKQTASTLSATARSSTVEVDSNPRSRSVATQETDSVFYLFRSLFSSACADKASFLLPYIIQFALLFHSQDDAFATQLAGYLNDLLAKADAQSDNEFHHCLSDVLSVLETLEAWRGVCFVRGKKENKAELSARSEVLDGFLKRIVKKEVVRVSVLLGQYTRSLK